MSLKSLLSIRIRFGEPPENWGTPIKTAGFWVAIIAPLFYLSALVGLANPDVMFDFSAPPLTAIISFGVPILAFGVQFVAAILLLKRRALGLALFLAGFLYFVPLISALGIAVAVLGSIPVIAGTLIAGLWSLWVLKRVNTAITDNDVKQVAAERIVLNDGHLHLLPGGAFDRGGAVNAIMREHKSTLRGIVEFAAVFVLIIFGPTLVPLTIGGGEASLGFAAPLLWFINTALFLGARGIVNSQILTLRAMAQSAAD